MKRQVGSLVLVFILLLPFATAGAAITWDGNFTTFRYDLSENGGMFAYVPSTYFVSNQDTESFYYDPSQGHTDPYNSTASGNLAEFGSTPGEVRMTAMAKGPAGGTSPSDGLEVQAFTKVALTDLTSHCIDVNQKALTWINRQFSVTTEAEYVIEASLAGLVNFADFGAPPYGAIYSLSGEVVLTEIVGTWGNEIFTQVAALPLSESTRDASIQMTLKPQSGGDPVRYELKAQITLETRLVNFALPNLVALGAFPNAIYELGSESAPMVVIAKVTSISPPCDQAEIQSFYQSFKAGLDSEDLTEAMALVDSSYLHDGEVKSDLQSQISYMFSLLSSLNTTFEVSNFRCSGDLAMVTESRTWQGKYDPTGDWYGKSEVIEATLKKVGGQWKYYGNQEKYGLLVKHSYGSTHGDNIQIYDPGKAITALTLTGGCISGSLSLADFYYDSELERWRLVGDDSLNCGTSPLPVPYNYTFVITDAQGTLPPRTSTVENYVTQRPTNLSPSNNAIVQGQLKFTWTLIPSGTYEYHIELFDSNNNRIWESLPTFSNIITYNGSPLPTGSYNYILHVDDAYRNFSVTLDSFQYTATLTGSLTMTLGPSGAVSAGAQWNVDGGAWQNSGATVSELNAGSHTVDYKTVPGWTAPNSESVTIVGGQNTSISGNYKENSKRGVSLPFLILLLED